MFAQVSGLGCIDLGDRRSRVQISAARQTKPQVGPYFRRSALWCVDPHVSRDVTLMLGGALTAPAHCYPVGLKRTSRPENFTSPTHR